MSDWLLLKSWCTMNRRSYQKVLRVLDHEARLLLLPELQDIFNRLMADAREPYREWVATLGRQPGQAEQNEWITQFLLGRPYADRYIHLCETLETVPNVEQTLYARWRAGIECTD